MAEESKPRISLSSQVADLEIELERLRVENFFLLSKNQSLVKEHALQFSRYKAENKALKKQNEALSDTMLELEEELKDFKRLLASVSSSAYLTSGPHRLPPELLHLVFKFTLPPRFLVDSSIALAPNSFWSQVHKQKNSIIRVCRAWYNVGLPFLYEHVVIHHVNQLSNLLRTLRDPRPSTSALNEMIKTVEVACFVPAWYMQYFEKHLGILYQICPNILSFTLAQNARLLPNRQITLPLPSFVTHLSLEQDLGAAALEHILELASSQLTFLHFHAPDADLAPPKTKRFQFPILQTMSISLSLTSPWWLRDFSHSCELPRLANASFYLQDIMISIFPPFPSGPIEEFCQVHGSDLQFLQLRSERLLNRHHINQQRILLSCPALEHVALSPGWDKPFEHRNIKWVDILESLLDPEEADTMLDMITSQKKLPALQGVRVLSNYLRDVRHPVPLLISPDSVLNTEATFSINFLGNGIRHGVGEVRWLQPEWSESSKEEVPSDVELDSDHGSSEWSTESEGVTSFVPVSDHESDDSDGSFESALGSDLQITNEDDAEMDNIETDLPWLSWT